MIVRHWTGRANPGDELAYVTHLKDEVIPAIRRLPGNLGARVLRGVGDAGRDFVVLTYWDRLASIEAFTGPDLTTAVVPPEAEALLAAFDPHARHFEVAYEAPDAGAP